MLRANIFTLYFTFSLLHVKKEWKRHLILINLSLAHTFRQRALFPVLTDCNEAELTKSTLTHSMAEKETKFKNPLYFLREKEIFGFF